MPEHPDRQPEAGETSETVKAMHKKATQIAPAYNKGALQYLPGGIDTDRWPARQERPARRRQFNARG